MKRILLTILPLLFLFTNILGQEKGHKIRIQVEGLENTTCLLAHHYGNKKFIKDTLHLNEEGWAVLEGDEPIPKGIYLFVLPNKQNYFEFIIDEQFFTLKTDTANLVKNMVVKNSKDNEAFFSYIRNLNKYQKEVRKTRKELKAIKKKDSKKAEKLRDQLQEINKKVQKEKERIIEKYPETFYAKVLRTMKDPEYPKIKKENGELDSAKSFLVYRQRYLENVDWSDDRLLRTPVLHNKLTTYMQDLTARHPDSIIVSADAIISRTDGNKETFKYIVNHLTTKYERSKYMGMDKVFVHLAEKYYLSGDAYWVGDKQMKKIRKRVSRIKPNLIGKKAPRLTMQNMDGEPVALYDIAEPVTVLFFWDSGCGHCQDAIPKLKELYKEYNKKGMEIFAVNIENSKKDWQKYVKKHDLPWINVQDRYGRSRFRHYYDIYSTPVIYVLGENKDIRAKRIGVKQLKDIVPRLLKKFNKSDKGTDGSTDKG